jgi:hypothetical protein
MKVLAKDLKIGMTHNFKTEHMKTIELEFAKSLIENANMLIEMIEANLALYGQEFYERVMISRINARNLHKQIKTT